MFLNPILLFALVATALWYLGNRAQITSFLWSRYPAGFASFMDCPACTGFWWGSILAATVGHKLRMSYLGLDLCTWWTWPLVGLCSIVLVPIVGGLMQRGLDAVGHAEPVE